MNICKFALKRECLVQIPSTDVATFKNILLFLFTQTFVHVLRLSGSVGIGSGFRNF